jgi:hypothetical protein
MFNVKYRSLMLILMVIWSIGIIPGCATLPNGRGWGQDATLSPGWSRVGSAALDAALDPGTWVPVAGALIFQIGNLDRQLSNWSSNHTPIFGSRKNADTASEVLQGVSEGAYVITALATPSGEKSADWAEAKLKGLGVGIVAIGLTEGVTTGLKYATHRKRPDYSNYESFPSGHASRTAVCDTLAGRNVDFLSIPDQARIGLQVGFAALTATTAWSRLEAKKHYPSDVLAGIALGHFFGAFINDAFLGAEDPKKIFLTLHPSAKEVAVGVYWGF